MRFNDSSEAPALIADTAPVPQPGRGEMLIRVHAAGVTPTELRLYPTTHTPDGGRRTSAIPGHEFSGVVEAVDEDVDPDQIGREGFGMNDWFADGATADYCICASTSVAVKPSGLSHLEAASAPIGALTAWQGLFERAKLQAGERILIHGGSGAVGVFAMQLARRAGAHDDPVGQRLEAVRALAERYRGAGIVSISHDFYPGGRHEMLHELNRADVLIAWLSDILERTSQ